MAQDFSDALPVDTVLHDQYRIKQVLGRGGFGVTYLATDLKLERPVAIKEYFPKVYAFREGGRAVHPKTPHDRQLFDKLKHRFLDEAKILARFHHPNIVQVLFYFEENGTAYMVMRFEEGDSFANLLKRRRRWSEADLLKLVLPLLDGLQRLHGAGYLHRDIKPDNIYIRQDGTPLLLDFGAARQAMGEETKTITIFASKGYSPPEQYDDNSKRQGAWTDIFAMGAVLYRAITGKIPNPPKPLSSQKLPDYSAHFLAAIDHALQPSIEDRPQSVKVWRTALQGGVTKGETNRRRWLRTAVIFLPLAAAVSGGYLYWQPFDNQRHMEAEPTRQEAEKKRLAEIEAERKRREEKKRLATIEAERKRQEKEKRLAAIETERKQLEKEKKRLAEIEAERKRREEKKRLAAIEAERKRQEEENKQREALKKAEVEEQQRLAEQRRLLAEREAKRLEEAKPKKRPPETWTDPTTGMVFIKITGGCFQMGSDSGDADEKPVHEVCVDDFWMGKFEVTNAQYRRFKSDHDSSTYKDHSLNEDQQPAVYVSWDDATAYAKWLSGKGSGTYRLPTEAEWEYAARAGTRTERFWGDGEEKACQYANVFNPSTKKAFGWSWDSFSCKDGYKVTALVGKFRANPFGLHDILGNVWEWTCSEYESSYDDKDGKEKKCANSGGGGSIRVSRGGSWFNFPAIVRSANRNGYEPGVRSGALGFRLLRTYP